MYYYMLLRPNELQDSTPKLSTQSAGEPRAEEDHIHPHRRHRTLKSSDQDRRQSQVSVVSRPRNQLYLLGQPGSGNGAGLPFVRAQRQDAGQLATQIDAQL